MAVNPMQRRAKNSFLIGFLIALILGALVAVFLVMQIKNIKEDYNQLKSLQKSVYVAGDYIQSGTEVDIDYFQYETVQTSINQEEFITADDFEFLDNEGDVVEKYDSKGNPIKKTMIVKTDIPAGAIITKDMLEEVENRTTDDLRLQEYNMIILPTLLVNGNYIDIRLRLPEGEDYIVVSKKKVIHSTEDTIWLKMSEDEILTLGNAIVEAYTINGSKLYATVYTEPGMQDAATPTYPVSQAVLTLINNNPNILQEAKNGLWARYNDQEQVEQRNNHINNALSDYYENMNDSVKEGLDEEIEKIKEARQTYIESLEGMGVVGTDN